MNSPWVETFDTEVREERDDDGVRIRGDAVNWLTVGEDMVGKEPGETGRPVDGSDGEVVRYAEKLNAGGRKKPVTGLCVAGDHGNV